jgi:hypothetical protein
MRNTICGTTSFDASTASFKTVWKKMRGYWMDGWVPGGRLNVAGKHRNLFANGAFKQVCRMSHPKILLFIAMSRVATSTM